MLITPNKIPAEPIPMNDSFYSLEMLLHKSWLMFPSIPKVIEVCDGLANADH